MLSVSGVRGIVGNTGSAKATMTPLVAAQFACAFASWLKEQHKKNSKDEFTICLGRDSRLSGQMLAQAAAAGLMSIGSKVIDLGVCATPTVGLMIAEHRAAGGLMITASHNPIQWNGIKSLNADGLAPPPSQAKDIIARYHAQQIDYAPVSDLHPLHHDDRGNRIHLKRVLASIDPAPIKAAKFKVVLDSVNGGGCASGKMLLEALGCEIIHINGEPTGHFAHTPEPIKENLTQLAEETKKHNAAVGFAQDPDADRLAIVDENGTFIGEEYTLALAAWQVFSSLPSPPGRGAGGKGRLDQSLTTAANLSTSRMIDDVAAKYSGKVTRTAVGEANVVEAMKTSGAIIGGEGNGGVIYSPVCWVRDSLSAMALVLSLMAEQKKTISALVNELPRYAMVKKKFDLATIGGAAAVPAMLQRVAEKYKAEKVSDVDGVRIDFKDGSGWVHLRPSNTEPIVRLIAEATDEMHAIALIATAAKVAGLD